MDLPTVTTLRRPVDRAGLAGLGPGAAVLAGGTWLFSEPQDHLHTLVDLDGLGWEPVTRTADGVSVAATCTLDELVAAGIPLADECVGALAASFKITSLATVGGNVCLALPAGSMTSLAVALDGVAVLWGPTDDRRVPVVDLVTGVRTTALRPGEVLRAIDLPAAALTERLAFRRAALSAQGRSGSVVIGRRGAGLVLSVTAATPQPHRLAFPDVPTASELVTALDAIPEWYDDPHGSPDWRRHVTGRLAEQIRTGLG
ncbi:FAD binding domain-containing protein [Pseudonocardia abyssalis]|uniref:FAD binding domain-containing protein n=1 Tax=Pseudonocardia abyssalis TaxID=2792008 RepID=A0ABS6UZR5_9PSEU|nr:FAD binding domain-containing protein [Pseudonocardia abyssalis]MBW0118098.1 FAD binding domain-containing protein [Pseudonocardia abyssalis]MBW0137471.1 FAD binding domain-containing protein [Pseudonocardia abyssalis]